MADLRGLATASPNHAVLTNTLSLQEAKDSSSVENIVATHDEVFRAET